MLYCADKNSAFCIQHPALRFTVFERTKMEYIIAFESTSFAIKAERLLLEQKLSVAVLPLPTDIRAGCGICLKLGANEIKTALRFLCQTDISGTKLYSREEENKRYMYNKVEDIYGFMEKKLTSLLDNCASGGCGAKISPGELSKLLSGLPVYQDENLLVGYDSSDDAGVYRLDERISIVTTADFFPPMVEDPKTFGRIAAANALSDIYAMGGRPVTALNLVCFPQSMDTAVLGEILIGGAEKVMEAGCVLAGGHSIYDKEPKYGLAVTGIVQNDRILRNNMPKEGHKLILTKPLGTGLIMSALRGGVASSAAVDKAIASMQRLNRYAAEKLCGYNVSACTDITGFGLLAHALEMASDRVSLLIYPDEIPFFEEAYGYAADFLMTAAGQRNREHITGKADVSALPHPMQELLFDPQTSGGLLLSVSPDQARELLAKIQTDDPAAKIIGEVVNRENAVVFLM